MQENEITDSSTQSSNLQDKSMNPKKNDNEKNDDSKKDEKIEKVNFLNIKYYIVCLSKIKRNNNLYIFIYI